MKKYEIEINNEVYHVSVRELEADANMGTTSQQEADTQETKSPAEAVKPQQTANGDGVEIHAPMAGTIYKIAVAPGDSVIQGDTLLVLEAMKMENEIVAPEDGVVGEIFVNTSERVESGQLLLTI